VQDQIIATGERMEGTPVVLRQVEGRPARSLLTPDARLRPEDIIETDQVSKAAVRAIDGTSIRLDRGARARLMSATAIELVAGSIYISTVEASRGFEVRTPLGVVHDVGTQFEVRVENEAVRVRVRRGMVEIRRNGSVVPARAGVETTVTPNGVDTRNVPPYGPDWEWMSSVAPPIDIEGRPLQEYLNRVTREEGWTLRYENAAVAAAAARIALHGTMKGLKTDEALGVALATSGLQYKLEQGELLVLKSPSGR
jgi:ferric-dicitrate binding protein FerR (iron transport regulator)